MDTHKNAPLTPKGREAMVRIVIEGGVTKSAAARRFNTTAKTVAKWVERFRAQGVDGLRDRSSKPHRLSALEPVEPIRRYQRENPGELIHIEHQKARQVQSDRPSHHRRSNPPEQPALPASIRREFLTSRPEELASSPSD